MCWIIVDFQCTTESSGKVEIQQIHIFFCVCSCAAIKLKLQILHMKNLSIYPWRHKNCRAVRLQVFSEEGERRAQQREKKGKISFSKYYTPASKWRREKSSHFQLLLLTRLPVFSCKRSRTRGGKEKKAEKIFFSFSIFAVRRACCVKMANKSKSDIYIVNFSPSNLWIVLDYFLVQKMQEITWIGADNRI